MGQKTGSEKVERLSETFKIEKIMAGDESKADKSKKGNKDDVESRINDIMMEGGKVIKMEVDYSETVAKKIPEAKKLAESNLDGALEKQTRQGADMHSTAKVLVCIVQLCYEAKKME